MGPLTDNQVANLISIERITACISVSGTIFLIATFIFFKEFRTLSNTLIFYASFANIFANVAALIGGSALSNTSGPLCQFQSFLLEMWVIFPTSMYSTAHHHLGSCNRIQCGRWQWL